MHIVQLVSFKYKTSLFTAKYAISEHRTMITAPLHLLLSLSVILRFLVSEPHDVGIRMVGSLPIFHAYQFWLEYNSVAWSAGVT